MFRQFALSIPGGAELLFRLHPVELSALLEQAWEFRRNDSLQDVGHPDRRSDLSGIPEYLLKGFQSYLENAQKFTRPTGGDCRSGCVLWEHLIYAYLIENSKVYEIFRRVLQEFRAGEKLGVPLPGSEHWLRNTEELFFREPAPFFISALTSYVRPDLDAIRRNAYYRMFGRDLTHPWKGKADESFLKPEAANVEFVSTFEDFLSEVWVGIENEKNTSGADPTDDAEIANLAEKLHDMLRTRRISGNLAREEFFFVSMMSWFHLTLEFNSPIVLSLRAEGTSPEQRLFKIAERVNEPAHSLAKNFFDIADTASRILIQIETGIYNTVSAVSTLYTPGLIEQDIRTIITHWSILTGRDLKARNVTAS
jgi:hypothetical protein